MYLYLLRTQFWRHTSCIVHIVIPGPAECGVGGEERTEDQPRLSVSVLQQPQPDLQCSNRQQTWLATSWS